jgi:uncharacterized protein (DUF2249 family)/iron-sulfur cluster repair protein YtfE (RIC family)
MNDVVIASDEADATAAQAVEQHHAQMQGALRVRVEALVAGASRGDEVAARAAQSDLVGWCRSELVPHAAAEEETLYPAARARTEARLLVESMLGEHQVIVGLVDELAAATDPVRAAAAARALQALFDTHLTKENELVLPVLVSAPDVSVAALLAGMHEVLGGESHEAHGSHEEQSGCGGHHCTCGEQDDPGFPELDARQVPHAIRHATVFGALDYVQPGEGLVLVAPHDPLPLLAQIEQRYSGAFAVEYLQRGPDAWRLNLVRRTA